MREKINPIITKSVEVIVFTFLAGRINYLILKHKQAEKHWSFAKGNLEEDESELQITKKELLEETHLKNLEFLNDLKKIHNYFFIQKGIKYNKKVTYLVAYSHSKKIKLSKEYSGYFWGNFEEILLKLEKDDAKNLLREVHQDIIKAYGPEKDNNPQEVLFVSFPKAGRTWVTFLIARILQKKYNLPDSDVVNLEKISRNVRGLPNMTVVHEDDPHKKDVESLSKSKLKHYNKKIILMVRDPRDIIVSFYFHQSRRKGEENYKKSISNFLFEKIGGFDVVIEYYNIWAKNRYIPADFLVVKYENFMRNTKKEVKKIINFMGLSDISDNKIEEAIKFSSFDNMKKMEAEGKFNVKRLKPANISDPDSFKVRRGIVGGYKNYLNERDIKKLNSKLKNLSEFYDYKI